VLKTILYGSEAGKREELELEQSYGKVLARGKYVHEIVSHSVKPGMVTDYLALVGVEYPKLAAETANDVHLVGSWRTRVGDLDKFTHIWEYKGYAGYTRTVDRLQKQPDYAEFQSQLSVMLRGRNNELVQEFSFWPTSPPRDLGGIFELRTYLLQPGKLLEWESHWRMGLQARKAVMEGVGAWFTQIGTLNRVHHMWQFKDLKDRQSSREKSWEIAGWSNTVHKTVPLIKRMDSHILEALPWSPLR